jgi:hypothetical protein
VVPKIPRELSHRIFYILGRSLELECGDIRQKLLIRRAPVLMSLNPLLKSFGSGINNKRSLCLRSNSSSIIKCWRNGRSNWLR